MVDGYMEECARRGTSDEWLRGIRHELDRWGCWMSASAAIREPSGQRIIAVLGMDVDAWQVKESMAQHRLSAIWLALLLNLMVVGLFAGLNASSATARRAAVAERRFRAVFEGAPEPVFLFDVATGRVMLANPAFRAWLGYGPDEVAGQSMPDLIGVPIGDIRSRLLAAPRRIQDWTFRRRDGTGAPAETAGAELRLQDAAYIVAFARDVMARKRDEAELQKSLGELERFNRLMVGREIRVLELKREVNALRKELGRPPAYGSVEPPDADGPSVAPQRRN